MLTADKFCKSISQNSKPNRGEERLLLFPKCLKSALVCNTQYFCFEEITPNVKKNSLLFPLGVTQK
jgi:hypothetical protein